MGSSTENSAFGPTKNPHDPTKVPGGSSGGSAAAVAAGYAPLALGSDTGGSIRQPAALCGVVGMKPTYGRVSRYGLVAFASSLDQIGPFARTVADAAVLFEVIAGHDPNDATSIPEPAPSVVDQLDRGVEGLRVGVVSELMGEGIAPDVAARVHEASEALRAAGAKVEEASVPASTFGLSAYYLIAPAEASSNLARFDGVRYGLRVDAPSTHEMMVATRTQGFGAEVKRRIMLGTYALSAGYYDAYYGKAQKVRTLIIRDFAAAYERFDVLHLADVAHDRLPARRQDRRPDGDVHERRVHHPLEPVRRPGDLGALRHRLRRPARRRAGAGARAGRGRAVPRGRDVGGERTMTVTETALDGWEMVIGLEVHAELATATKMFSGAPNQFGDEPNTNVDPVSLGLPGSLPVLNEQAVELAIRLGLALNCEIRPSVFARKNYFYPDMPKDFQISQYDQPIDADGWLDLPSGTRIGIERAHLEEDTGKSTHVGGDGRITGATYSLVDYNRAGVPLLEIVSRPDLRNADDAKAYVTELRAILVATGVSDGKMEEGSMRVDANVSVRRSADDPFGTRCEIKNLNSVRSLGRAIDYEARRQVDMLEAGESVRQETRHWDEDDGRTHTMRVKEEADDYRYFPEPDLVPLDPDAEWIERVRAALPVLPAQRRADLAAAAGVDLPHSGVALWSSAARTPRRSRPSRPAAIRRGCWCTSSRTSPPRAAPSSTRPAWPPWSGWRPAASSRPRRPRPCSPRCSPPTPRPRTSPPPTASRRWTPEPSPSSSTA